MTPWVLSRRTGVLAAAGLAVLLTAGCGGGGRVPPGAPAPKPGGIARPSTSAAKPAELRDITGEDLCSFVSAQTVAKNIPGAHTSPSTSESSRTGKKVRCTWSRDTTNDKQIIKSRGIDVDVSGYLAPDRDPVESVKKTFQEWKQTAQRKHDEGLRTGSSGTTTYTEPRDLPGVGDEAFSQYNSTDGKLSETMIRLRVGVWQAELSFHGKDVPEDRSTPAKALSDAESTAIATEFAKEIAVKLADDSARGGQQGAGSALCKLLSAATAEKYAPNAKTENHVSTGSVKVTECSWQSSEPQEGGKGLKFRSFGARVEEYGKQGQAIFDDHRKKAKEDHDAGPVHGKGPATEGQTKGEVKDVPGLGQAAYSQVTGNIKYQPGEAGGATVTVLLSGGRIATVSFGGYDGKGLTTSPGQEAGQDRTLQEAEILAAVNAAAKEIIPGLA
ncbi:hypothetical protein [Actinocrispum wychmicini]|uniref:Uncharacterized protein n=1 Tax=Actinocrispum wychmicini TaxID=1213861 RepID=A0A4R2JN01_9PSEU|nr:hypothetical protein [Actinocrispum wychmicini]TCO58039.1 hypothetical protein EV192_105102 [Actinocrispum wychmicini]